MFASTLSLTISLGKKWVANQRTNVMYYAADISDTVCVVHGLLSRFILY